MKHNIIQDKAFQFALKIIEATRTLQTENEFILSRQLLRSCTSIGANIEESIGGYSKADFLSKITIAYKEARESIYWIKLLKETQLLNESTSSTLLENAEELCRIIGKIQITLKKSNSLKN